MLNFRRFFKQEKQDLFFIANFFEYFIISGHYTQVMWRNSRRLGCGVAEVSIRRGSFTYKSTWLVSHYAPAGNVRSRSPQQTINIFNFQVPDTRLGEEIYSVSHAIGVYPV